MALRKIIEVEGKTFIQSDVGVIEIGVQKVTFSAYAKVVSISGDKSLLNVIVNFTGDTQRFNKQYQLPVSVDAGSANFIAQVYAYLKTLPEFDGAEDC